MAVAGAAYTEVGLFEAKTKLSEIMRKVEQGERFTITVRGKAVADVLPASQGSAPWRGRHVKPEERAAALERLRNPRITGISHEEIRAAIEEGRH